MKFYKRQNIDKNNPVSDTFAVQADGRIITDTTRGLQTPRGDAAQRSDIPVNGEIRYNNELGIGGELEAYVNGNWEIIKTNRQQIITKQVFNNGDYLDTIFGPLAYDIDVNSPQSVMLYVENVYQIPDINYSLILSTDTQPLTTSTTIRSYVGFSETVIPLEDISDFNPGRRIDGTNLTGNVVVATSATDRTITIFPGALGVIPPGGLAIAVCDTGTYVKFTYDAIPAPSKPVVAILGLNGYTPPFEV